MNKKFKVVSSLALAGLLTLNVLNVKTLAATVDDKIETNPVGVYRKLVEGKAVVPYVLIGKDDVTTVKEIVNSGEFANVTQFNGTAIPNENTIVKTGDTFVADGTTYTVVVYGDVNHDGRVNSSDALKVEEYAVEMASFDAVESEAADVKNDGKLNSFDSLAIKEYSAELREKVIDTVPAKEAEQNYNYTVTVNNNGKVNAQNASTAAENTTKSTLKVSLKQTYNTSKTLKVIVIGADGEKHELGTINVPAHTNYVEQSEFDFSDIPDGNILGTLLETVDGKDVVVGTFRTEKNTVIPEATNVRTTREGTKTGKLSLEAAGESDIVKVHYVVKDLNTQLNNIQVNELVNVINVNNNKITSETVSTELVTNKAYKVYYILENSYGSKSEIKEVIITSDSNDVTTATKLAKVVAPDITHTSSGNFSWSESGSTYVVTLYKDGKAVKACETSSNSVDFTNLDSKNYMAEPGTYRVEVYVKGTDMKRASDVTSSGEVKIERLATVSSLALSNVGNTVVLSWKNSNPKANFSTYNITLVPINEDGTEGEAVSVESPVTDEDTTDVNKVDVTSKISPNIIYKAKVVVLAKANQMAKISSEEEVSEEFYVVGRPSASQPNATETSITLSSEGININGKTATYQVKVYDVNANNTPEQARYTLKTTQSVSIVDGKIVINGLESDKLYAFKLVATVEGKTVESAYTDEVRTLPYLHNLTVVDSAQTDAKTAGKVYAVDTDTIVVEGKTIDLTNYNSNTKLANSMAIINALEVGDTVNIDNENVSVKLDGGASADVAERDFNSVDLTKINLTVESNNFSKTIKTNTNGAKSITLKGTGSIFDMKDAKAGQIILTNNVEVASTATKTYTIDAGANAIVNGLKITTQKATVVTSDAAGAVYTVEANKEANDLVFESKKDQEITIKFNGAADNSSAQAGSIKIKTNGGKVTVSSEKVNVNAELTVEVNNGEVDVTEPSLTGNKTVTVPKDANAKITMKAKTVAPAKVAAKAKTDEIELKNYTDDELKTLFSIQDAAEINAARAYLNSFGLNEKGAKLKIKSDDTTNTIVEISFAKATANSTIENVK